jgi:hypothetical protein
MFADNKEIKAPRVFYEVCIEPGPDRFFLQHRLPKVQSLGHVTFADALDIEFDESYS